MDSSQYAQEWLKYAKMDYDAARHLQSHQPVPFEIICYHCQQAGEKALKAVLAYHNLEIPRTHNLYTVLAICAEYYNDMLPIFLESATRLSIFATVTRYPDNVIELNEADMIQALKDADKILQYVSSTGIAELG